MSWYFLIYKFNDVYDLIVPWNFSRHVKLDCMFLSCQLCVFRVNLHSIVAWMSRNSLLETGAIFEVISLAKWLSVCLQTRWLWIQILLQSYKSSFASTEIEQNRENISRSWIWPLQKTSLPFWRILFFI